MNEKEVEAKMAEQDKNNDVLKNLENRLNRGKTELPQGQQQERQVKVDQTNEFDGEHEEVKEKEATTSTSEGVSNWKEMPITPDNDMPKTDGEIASEPYITWERKRPVGGTVVYGRFYKNVKGEKISVDITKRNAVKPEILIPAEQRVKARRAALQNNEAVRNITPSAQKLRDYMSLHSRWVCATTDRDNQTTIRITNRVDDKGLRSTDFKAVESGYGTIKQHFVYYPKRAYEAFQTAGAKDDQAIVGAICEETEPQLVGVWIDHRDITAEIGTFCSKGILPFKGTQDTATASKVISEDFAEGVPEILSPVFKGGKTFGNPTDPTEIEKMNKYAARKAKLVEEKGGIGAALAMEFKFQSNVRRKLVSPMNTIPLKTQVTIPAGKAFTPREGASAAELTDIYMTEQLKKQAAANATIDSVVGTVGMPSDKKPFLFVPVVRAQGVGENPVFYQTGTTAVVEPYFTTLVKEGDTFKARKLKTKELTSVVKKVATDKPGRYVIESVSIVSDQGYDMSSYNGVKDRVRVEYGERVYFPTIEEIRQQSVKAKRASGSTRSTGRSVVTQNPTDFLDAYQVASIVDSDRSEIQEFLQAQNDLKKIKKDGEKASEWTHILKTRTELVRSRNVDTK